MQLTRFTDLGLRVLLYLTHKERDTFVTIAEIAEQFEVPHNHLIKVVNRLGKLGWIVATRGRNGGLNLVCDPRRLSLSTIIQGLEGTTQLIDCASPPCALKSGCQLKSALDIGLRAFYASLEKVYLADMVKTPTGEKIVKLHRDYQLRYH